jgi:4-hydroxythreonine-4-phosphate dehydrogenase
VAVDLRILVTLGDPAGIGPEVVDAALRTFAPPPGCAVEVVGDAAAGRPGHPDRRSAAAALEALEFAAAELAAGRAHAVATGPVSKAALQSIGFPFPGQTEFFAERLGAADFAMCLAGRQLTIALATLHLPLARVAASLDTAAIVHTGRLLAAFLRCRGIARPRVAVCGLNPHAGEHGAFGDEEDRLIAPAVERLRDEAPDTDFSGPHVPDAVFREAAAGRHDAVLAMYHDQGLIPFKLLEFDRGVNVTLGLPRPRVSPDHGTAFGIAGRGLARPDSMRHAIELACQLANPTPP